MGRAHVSWRRVDYGAARWAWGLNVSLRGLWDEEGGRSGREPRALALDQANLARPWPLLGFLGRELYSLTFPQELEDSAAHSTSVEEVLDSPFVADEPEPLVNQQTRYRAARHTFLRRFAASAPMVEATAF